MIHNLFIQYCDRHEIGNAYLNTTGDIGIVTEKGITRFNNMGELVRELKN